MEFNLDYLLDNTDLLHMPGSLGHINNVVNKKFFLSVLDRFYSQNSFNDDVVFMLESGWFLLGSGVYKCNDYALPKSDLGKQISMTLDSKRRELSNMPFDFECGVLTEDARRAIGEITSALNPSVMTYVDSVGTDGMRIEKKDWAGVQRLYFYIKNNNMQVKN